MQQNQMRIKIDGEIEIKHIIYINSPFLKGYIKSSLPTSKESSLITLNCKLYTIKNPSCTLPKTHKTL